jgi:lia operon protein LiaG
MLLISRKTSLFGAFLAAVVVSPSTAQTERRTLTGDRISVYNLAGRLRVQAGTGAGVTVEVTRGGRDAGQLSLQTGLVRGANTLRVVYPSDRIVYREMGFRSRTQIQVDNDGTFGDHRDRDWSRRNDVEIRDSGSGLDAYADLVVSVARGQQVAVHWGVGEAVVSNVDGQISVSVASAKIRSEHTRGSLFLDTGSGSVSVVDAQGTVNLDTGSGSVTVDGVRGDDLTMDTGSGSLSVTNVDVRTLKADVGSGGLRLGRIKAARVNLDAGSGGIDLDLVSTVEELLIDTGSGGVTIRMPAAQGAEVDIETSSGGIESDFAVQTTRFGRNHLRGRIGDGRGRIRIESGSGRVRLIKAG